MDESAATRIAEKLRARYPDVQVVQTGGGFINVFWTENIEGELRSFVLGGEEGAMAVDIYHGDYMNDDEALYLWPYEFDELTEDEVVATVMGGEIAAR